MKPWLKGRCTPVPMARGALRASACCTYCLACRTASRRGRPFARPAAMALASVQPVPCVLPVSTRGSEKRVVVSPSNSTSTTRSSAAAPKLPGAGCGSEPPASISACGGHWRCPPLTSTAPQPVSCCRRRAATSICSTLSMGKPPSRADASGKLGVTIVARGKRCLKKEDSYSKFKQCNVRINASAAGHRQGTGGQWPELNC